MYQVISTDAVPPSQRRAYWHEAIQPLFVPRDCAPLANDGSAESFCANVMHASLGDVGFLRLVSGPHAVQRTHRHILPDEEPCYLLSLVSEGWGYLRQDSRESVQRPGEFVLYRSDRPFQLGHPEQVRKYVLKIPQTLLAGLVPLPDKLCGITVGTSSVVRSLLVSLLDSVAAARPHMGDQERRAVARAVLELVGGAMAGLSSAQPGAVSQLRSYHLSRIKRHVQDRLHDPELSCEGIARDLRMSVSSLYRIFEQEPTPIGKWIWQLRLEAAARDLAKPDLRRCSLTDIAFRRGFSSCAHFSRAFKEHHGMTPTEYRRRHALPPVSATPGDLRTA